MSLRRIGPPDQNTEGEVVRPINDYLQSVAIDADISGAGTTESTVCELAGRSNFSAVIKSTLTLSGSWVLYVSNNYDRANPAGARWAPITDPVVAAYLALDIASGGGKPNGTAGASAFAKKLTFQAVKMIFTYASGSGHLFLDLHGAS